MMLITMVPVEVSTFLQSRRGSKVFRRVKVPPNTREIDYNALPSCALELVDITEHVWARADVEENRGALTLTYIGPSPKKQFNQQEFVKAEAAKVKKVKEEVKLKSSVSVKVEKVKVNEGTTTQKADSRP